jgi:hypothetical protein
MRGESVKKLIPFILVMSTIPASADVLDELFGAPTPHKAPFDIAAEQCTGNKKARTVEIHDRYMRCIESHPLASRFSTPDKAYLIRMQQTSLAAHRGGDYQTLKLEERAWRIAQIQERDDRAAQYAQQRRMVNAVESIPLQQAHWAITRQGINQAGRGYTPRMYTTHY